MVKMMNRTLASASLVLLLAGLACGGGVDPRDLPVPTAAKKDRVTAAPEETATAVRRARQAVSSTPAPAAPVMTTPAPRRAAPAAAGADWSLASTSGCEPLENVRRQGAEVGTFATPQEFARKLQQRGYQAFVLDVGQEKGQVVRVRVPDLQADFEFRRAGLCR